MLKSLFYDFLEDLAKDAVKLINKFLVDLMDIALNCQNYISTKHLIKGLSLSKVNAVILKYAIALLILKFVQKGFSIYILQSDGDPDHDPIHILTGFCQAVAISVTFLGLYTPLVNIFETFTKAILTAIGSKGEIEAIKDQFLLTLFGNGITTVLLFIIFLIIIFLIKYFFFFFFFYLIFFFFFFFFLYFLIFFLSKNKFFFFYFYFIF